MEYHRETLNFGEFVAQLDTRHSKGPGDLGIGPLGFATQRTSARITLRDLGWPVTARILADTTIGDMATELTDGLARAYLLSLRRSFFLGIRVMGGWWFRAECGRCQL